MKNTKKNECRQEERHSKQQPLVLTEFVRETLYQFVIGEGVKALQVMLEEDREKLYGAVSGHQEAPLYGEDRGS